MGDVGSRFRIDFLSLRPVRGLVVRAWFPVAVQALGLAVVGLLAAAGLGVGEDAAPGELLLLRKTNLSTLVVWGLWWPGLVIVTLLLGRAWCTVCPMELASRGGEWLGKLLGLRRMRVGSVVRAGWLAVAGYLVLQVLVAGVSVHRVPHLTAVMLLVLVALPVLAGMVLREPRAFCRALCPAAPLLSVYGRLSPFQLDVKDPAKCAACASLDCVRHENRQRFDRRSCPSLLKPFAREPSDGCVQCLQCAKVCPHGNVGFGVVSGSTPADGKPLLRPAEAAFVLAALGFVSHDTIAEVAWLDQLFHAVPSIIGAAVPGVGFEWWEAIWFLLLFPAVAWGIVFAAGYLTGHRGTVASAVVSAATGAAPVVAVAHAAKAVAKISTWCGYLPVALSDPSGRRAAAAISAGLVPVPGAVAGLSAIGWTMLLFTVAVGWIGLRWARQLPVQGTAAARTGLAFAVALFTGVLATWGLMGS